MFRYSLIRPTFVGTSERRLFRVPVQGMLAATALAVSLLLANEPAAQNISGSCDAGVTEFNRFLHCAATAVASSAMNPSAFTREPLHGYLKKLESMPGYVGDPADIDLLKRVSLDLKKNPDKNQEAISAIDSAVASHAAELRQALSRGDAARGIDNGFDIYPKFVEQDLSFFWIPPKSNFMSEDRSKSRYYRLWRMRLKRVISWAPVTETIMTIVYYFRKVEFLSKSTRVCTGPQSVTHVKDFGSMEIFFGKQVFFLHLAIRSGLPRRCTS